MIGRYSLIKLHCFRIHHNNDAIDKSTNLRLNEILTCTINLNFFIDTTKFQLTAKTTDYEMRLFLTIKC